VNSAFRPRESRIGEELLALFGLALVTGIYFVIRSGGRWAETDTGLMTQAIRVVADSGHLSPEAAGVYGNGYGYQAVSMTIMAFTGLSVEALQQVVYPLLSAVLVLPAWALYRELTGSGRVATLATLLLLLVPEHLFAVLRGSHERLDRAFLLTALFLLVRSLHFRADPPRFAVHVGLAVLMTYGLIATNALFGISFAVAIAMALAITWLARRGPAGVRSPAIEVTRHLRWISALVVVLVGIFILFVYPPIGQSLRALAEIPGTLADLVLNARPSVDPYAGVLAAWVSPAAYLLLSIGEFLLLGGSVLVWLWLGWSWLRGGSPASIGIWILWLLYAAFAVQGAAAIISDRTGALGGNFQYRAFAVFATMAAPLVAVALSRLHPRPWLRSIAMAFLAVAAVAALVKATNEPAVSNRWTFYTASELQGLRWADSHQRSTDTWVGPDERLAAAYEVAVGDPTGANGWDIYDPKPGTQSFLVSNVIHLQGARLGSTLPPLGSKDVIYDNGDVQLYRSRPLAAFDR
jgi:hypothetical protein